MDADRALVPHTGTTANLVRNKISECWGTPRAETHPACARFKFGAGCLGEPHYVSETPVGIAGNRGKSAAFAPGADIPASLRKGALEAPCGQSGLSRNISASRKQGGNISLKLTSLRRYVLSVAPLGEEQSKYVTGPTLSAAYSVWAASKRRPNLLNGGLRLPYEKNGLYRFDPPRASSECKAVTLGGAFTQSGHALSRRPENYNEVAYQFGPRFGRTVEARFCRSR